jgi:hypothetical protein
MNRHTSDLVKIYFYIGSKHFIHNELDKNWKIGHLVGLGSKVHGSRLRVNRVAFFFYTIDLPGSHAPAWEPIWYAFPRWSMGTRKIGYGSNLGIANSGIQVRLRRTIYFN